MLQPVMTRPSMVSSAAPTLKCEYAAQACSRARRASETSSTALVRSRSELSNDGLQQCDELTADSARRFQHFRVIERLRQHPRRHVRDARNAEDLDAHVPGN